MTHFYQQLLNAFLLFFCSFQSDLKRHILLMHNKRVSVDRVRLRYELPPHQIIKYDYDGLRRAALARRAQLNREDAQQRLRDMENARAEERARRLHREAAERLQRFHAEADRQRRERAAEREARERRMELEALRFRNRLPRHSTPVRSPAHESSRGYTSPAASISPGQDERDEQQESTPTGESVQADEDRCSQTGAQDVGETSAEDVTHVEPVAGPQTPPVRK